MALAPEICLQGHNEIDQGRVADVVAESRVRCCHVVSNGDFQQHGAFY